MAAITLNSDEIVRTSLRLQNRVEERFPSSGLSNLAAELSELARRARGEADAIRRPIYPLRAAVILLVALVAVLLVAATIVAMESLRSLQRMTMIDLLTAAEAGTNEIVLIGIALLFLISLENRIKRRRALKALHALRAMAHVIDMHQLTKDPGRYLEGMARPTASSPQTVLSLPELIRYLNYCSELLSITGKIAAVYIQHFDDEVTLASASEVEALVTALARKIWQKIMIAEAMVQ